MSTRVCLMIICACWALAGAAEAQAQRISSGDQLTSPNSGSSSPRFPAGTHLEASHSHVSNVPLTVSSAGGLAVEAPGAAAPAPVANEPAARDAPLPLPPRSSRQSRQARAPNGSSTGRAMLTVISSLAIVLAVFFAFVWLSRSAAPKGMAPLSKEVVESLGRAPLLGRQQMQLIRIGNKLILLSVTATGADTLTEITDPVEVDRLAGLCRQSQAGSISDTFRHVLAQATTEPAPSASASRAARRTGSMEPYRA